MAKKKKYCFQFLFALVWLVTKWNTIMEGKIWKLLSLIFLSKVGHFPVEGTQRFITQHAPNWLLLARKHFSPKFFVKGMMSSLQPYNRWFNSWGCCWVCSAWTFSACCRVGTRLRPPSSTWMSQEKRLMRWEATGKATVHLPVLLLRPPVPWTMHPLAHSRMVTPCFCSIFLFSAGSFFLQLVPSFSLIAKLLERVAYTQSHSPRLFLEPIPIRLLSLQAQGSQQHLMKVISFLEPLSSLDFLNPTLFRFLTHCLLFSILTYWYMLLFFKKYIYLALLGLSCGLWDL